MLKVILKRLKPQAEEMIAEKQAGFRVRRKTTEQILNLRILCENILPPPNISRISTMSSLSSKKSLTQYDIQLYRPPCGYNISANLVHTIELLNINATSAVQMNGSMGEWFRTTVGARQGCLLSPTLFDIFLERIISDAQEDHEAKVSIGGRYITSLRFADDIDAVVEEEQESEALVESLDNSCPNYKMEISAERPN